VAWSPTPAARWAVADGTASMLLDTADTADAHAVVSCLVSSNWLRSTVR
jgi:hypothetical protein